MTHEEMVAELISRYTQRKKELEIVKTFNNKDLFINSCIKLRKTGYTIEQIESMSGVTRKTISKWLREKGHSQTKQETSMLRGYYKR